MRPSGVAVSLDGAYGDRVAVRKVGLGPAIRASVRRMPWPTATRTLLTSRSAARCSRRRMSTGRGVFTRAARRAEAQLSMDEDDDEAFAN